MEFLFHTIDVGILSPLNILSTYLVVIELFFLHFYICNGAADFVLFPTKVWSIAIALLTIFRLNKNLKKSSHWFVVDHVARLSVP